MSEGIIPASELFDRLRALEDLVADKPSTANDGRLSSSALDGRYAPLTAPQSIFVVGDSLTSHASSGNSAWHRVGALLAGDVVNLWWSQGASGYNLAQIQSIILPVALASPATHVCIAGGTNDAGPNFDAASWLATLDAMIASVLAAGKVPILWAPPPRTAAAGADYLDSTATMAYLVKQRAAENGWEVVDAHRVLADATGRLSATYDSGDGIHPNDAGYELLGIEFESVLRRLFPRAIHTMLSSQDDPAVNADVGLFLVDTNADGLADGVSGWGGATGTVVAGAPVGQWQRKPITAGTTSPGGIRITTSGLTPGHLYEISVRIRADLSATGTGCSTSVSAGWRTSGGTLVDSVEGDEYGPTGAGSPLGAFSRLGLLGEEEVISRVVDTCPETADRIWFDLLIGGTAVGSNGWVQIAQYGVRDLTALGLV